MQAYISKSLDETKNIAKEIAAGVFGGEVFALHGDLGSGKTTFTKYLALALGIRDEITSPTFVIMKSYPFQKDDKNLNLIHIDAYRFNDPEDADSIGLEDILADKKNVTVIESPEKITAKLLVDSINITFEFVSETTRSIKVG